MLVETNVGAEKCIEISVEDVTSVLLNTDEKFVNSIYLLKNMAWHMLSRYFLVTLGNSGLY